MRWIAGWLIRLGAAGLVTGSVLLWNDRDKSPALSELKAVEGVLVAVPERAVQVQGYTLKYSDLKLRVGDGSERTLTAIIGEITPQKFAGSIGKSVTAHVAGEENFIWSLDIEGRPMITYAETSRLQKAMHWSAAPYPLYGVMGGLVLFVTGVFMWRKR